MKKNKIELICEIIIKGLPLTEETLFNNGLTISEINELLEEQLLFIEGNTYKLYSLYELFYYGIKLLSQHEHNKAKICFDICYRLEPNNRDFALQLFLSSLKLGDYKIAAERFSIMEKIKSQKNITENNLYLYLLSIITSCPKEYEERLSNIDYDSVLLPANSNEYHKEQINNIGHAVMKNKFEYALEILNTTRAKEPFRLVNQEVLRELLIQVINHERKFYNNILYFANNQRYPVIMSFIENKHKKRYLSNNDVYIYILTSSLNKIINTKEIPEITIFKTKFIYEALKGNNFLLARKINNKMLKREAQNVENEIIKILLKDLNQLIYNIKKEQTEKVNPSTENKNNLEEIANYLHAENISLEEAKEKLNLTDEQILLIKLIYAINYYKEEMYLLGDILLKEVEKSSKKTPEVLQKINEIRINKRFYKNKKEEYTRKRTMY